MAQGSSSWWHLLNEVQGVTYPVLAEEEVIEEVKFAPEDGDFTITHIRKQGSKSPAVCAQSFTTLLLKPALLNGIYSLEFFMPTKAQRYLLPAILAIPPVNVFAHSWFDTGKRTAVIIAILNAIDADKKYPQVICLSSESALVLQNAELATSMAKYMSNVTMYAAVDGAPWSTKLQDQIIFGTPDIITIAANQDMFDYRKIKILAVQDFDVISNSSYFALINGSVSQQCQKIFFQSNTTNELHEIATTKMHNPFILLSKTDYSQILENISHFSIFCASMNTKYEAVKTICNYFRDKPILIFCSRDDVAKTLAVRMIIDKFDVVVCSGDLTFQQMACIYKQFQEDEPQILIATDALTRGIHLNDFGVVCNYDVPHLSSSINVYVDRVTRAGSAYENGVVFNLIDSTPSLNYIKKINQHFNKPCPSINIWQINNVRRAQYLLDS